MYDLAISTGDLAAVVSAIAALGVLLGMLLGWILRYLLGIEKRLATLEAAIKDLQDKCDTDFHG